MALPCHSEIGKLVKRAGEPKSDIMSFSPQTPHFCPFGENDPSRNSVTAPCWLHGSLAQLKVDAQSRSSLY